MSKKDEKIAKEAVRIVAIATGHPEVPLAMETTEVALKKAKKRNIIFPSAKKPRWCAKGGRRRGLAGKLLKGY